MSDKRMLFIGELAKAVGVRPQTIRYYEREGLLRQTARTRVGYRLYDEDAVARVRFIKAAQSLGLSLREIRELIALGAERSPCGRVRKLLREKLQALDRRIAELRAFRRELAAQIAALDQLPDQADSSPYVCSLIMTIARHHGPPQRKKGGMTDAMDTTDRVAASFERSGRDRGALRVQGSGESDELSRSDRLSAHGKDHLSRRLPAEEIAP